MKRRVETTDLHTNPTAEWLYQQHLQRNALTAFPSEVAPADLAAAYLAQNELVRIKSRVCGPIIGWKIALSNPAMQAFCGLDSPIAGHVHASQVVSGPAHVRASDYVRLLIEFEIALQIDRDLPAIKGGYSRTQVERAVSAVRPAFEIADDRGADYATLSQHGLQLVADNAWNQGAVLGEQRTDWRKLDLDGIRGTVHCDGELIGQGHGRDQMGHPLDAMTWLVNNLSGRGLGMKAGDFAILGSLVTSKFPQAGQRWVFELDGFEPLQLQID